MATAGFIFTKLLRVPIKSVRSKGHKLIVFLDDGIGGHSNLGRALELSSFVHELLISLGFLIAENKCKWTPSQSITWLGHVWLMEQYTLHITEDRIKRLEIAIDSLMYQIRERQCIHARFLASVIGQIISMKNVLQNMVSFKTRALYECLEKRLSWESRVVLSDRSQCELVFWRQNARKMNELGCSLAENTLCDLECFSDASGLGYGGYVALCAGALVEGSEVIGCWNETETNQSSTWRETQSVERVLRSNSRLLEGKRVKMYCDNKNVISILSKGSRKQILHNTAENVQQFCNERNISLCPEWIARGDNVLADDFSLTYDNDDWAIKN